MKCRECKVCNGKACAGEIPGVGGKGSGSSFIRNVEALKNVKINFDLINDDVDPDTSSDLFGYQVSMPVYVAPIAGIKNNYGVDMSEYEYNYACVKGASEFGSFAFTGDGINANELFEEGLQAIDHFNGRGIVTVKPWRKEGILKRLEIMEKYNYFALATDIDAAGLPLLKKGDIKTELKNVNKLKELKSYVNCPLIVKGIMSVDSALKAIEAGAEAIVVSNHGGRVMDDTLATIEVLPSIVAACKGSITILIDGGFHSGVDVFKALALGADGVLIGRGFALSCVKDKELGVINYFQKIQTELIETMVMTGCEKISDISAKCVTNLNK